MSLTYDTWQSGVTNLCGGATMANDPNFLAALPLAVDAAELRIYRDLDLLDTSEADASGSLSAGDRSFDLPGSKYVVIDTINVLIPLTTTSRGSPTPPATLTPGPVTTGTLLFGTPAPDFTQASGGAIVAPVDAVDPATASRHQLLPVSLEWLDRVYGSPAFAGMPRFFCAFNQNTIMVGPFPDQDYGIEVVGTIRPTPMSADNESTVLLQWFPDLLIDASMSFLSGYMKNYGAQVDDPGQGVTWETQYLTRLKSAAVEEARKKFHMQGSSRSAGPSAGVGS